MSLSPDKQLSLSAAAAAGDWDQERIDAVARVARTTETGAVELAHVEEQMGVASNQLSRGLGLTAAQSMEIDAAAAAGNWDQDRIDRARAAAIAANSK